MRKSLFSKSYAFLLAELRRARKRARLTQGQLAERIGATQSFVSKCERGERRLDILEFRAWCRALNISFVAFTAKLDRAVGKGDGS